MPQERDAASYFPVSGTPREGMLLADMHAHVRGDTSGKPKDFLFAAQRSGITYLTITDHDSTQSFNECSEINEREGLGLRLIRSVESTAVVESKRGKRGKPRHVLVYDIKEAPPCYMPVKELNEWAHDQGGYTSAAHLGLGAFSMTQSEMLRVQDDSDPTRHFDFAEVRNGGILTLNAFVRKHPLTASALISVGLMPTAAGLHEETERFLAGMKERLGLKGVTVGSDGHDVEKIGELAIAVDPAKGLFRSLSQSDSAIMQRRTIASERPIPFVEKTFKSWKLEFDRRRGRNGIALYVPRALRSKEPAQEAA